MQKNEQLFDEMILVFIESDEGLIVYINTCCDTYYVFMKSEC